MSKKGVDNTFRCAGALLLCNSVAVCESKGVGDRSGWHTWAHGCAHLPPALKLASDRAMPAALSQADVGQGGVPGKGQGARGEGATLAGACAKRL